MLVGRSRQTRVAAATRTRHPFRRGAAAAVVLLFWLTSGALPAAAQDSPGWLVRGELGATEIHGGNLGLESDLDDLWGGVRVGRILGRSGSVATDLGMAGSSADGGFTTLTAGLELRAFARSRVSPFARAELGYLSEARSTGCFVAGLGAGLSFRIARPVALRVAGSSSRHCGDYGGPAVVSLGLEFRW